MPIEEPTPPVKNKMSLSFDPRLIIAVLLVIIGVMLVMWKPWDSVSSDARTISVTGETTISAEPDEYVFYPSYQFQNTNKDVALAELTTKSDAVVNELKKLGVEDSQIKTNSGGYDYPLSIQPDSGEATYTLTLTITLSNKDLAQKVQDYLITTSPLGAVSPQANFSDGKRKELENKARDQATKDARSKADQSAQNLGFKLGKVKEVSDGAGFGGPIPYLGAEASGTTAVDSKRQLAVQPGQNDLSYSVTVVYFVK